jgi:hypothetical protein
MAGNVSFHTLVEALATSVIEAQDRIELHQLSHLRDYFDEDNRPKSVNIRMPSLLPDAEEGDEDLYRAPLLPLVATSNLRIKEVEISFDADLSELGEEEPAEDGATSTAQDVWEQPKKTAPRIGMDTAPTKGKGSVHVVLRVEGIEPSDGAARLINQLAQAQGVFKTVKAT